MTEKRFRNLKGDLGGLTQEEVAKILNISQQGVDQLERSAILKLKIGLGIVQRVKVPRKPGQKGRSCYLIIDEPTPEGRELAAAFNEFLAARTRTANDFRVHNHKA